MPPAASTCWEGARCSAAAGLAGASSNAGAVRLRGSSLSRGSAAEGLQRARRSPASSVEHHYSPRSPLKAPWQVRTLESTRSLPNLPFEVCAEPYAGNLSRVDLSLQIYINAFIFPSLSR